MECAENPTKSKQNRLNIIKMGKKKNDKKNFIRILIVDKGKSLKQCGGGHLCNEPRR